MCAREDRRILIEEKYELMNGNELNTVKKEIIIDSNEVNIIILEYNYSFFRNTSNHFLET